MTDKTARYPDPPGMRQSWAVAAVAGVFLFSLFSFVGLWFTFTGALTGDVFRTIFGVSMTVGFCALSWRGIQSFRLQNRVIPPFSASVGTNLGVQFKYDRIILSAGLLVTVCFVLLATVFAGVAWFDIGSLPMTPGQEIFFPLGFIAFAMYTCYESIRDISRRKGLLVDRKGLQLRGVRGFSVSWDQLVSVGVQPKADAYYRGFLILGRKRLKPSAVKVDQLAIGLPVMYWFIDFYLNNPDLRGELSTGEAVRRIEMGETITRPGWINRA